MERPPTDRAPDKASDDEIAAVAAFLQSAPPQVRAWLTRQATPTELTERSEPSESSDPSESSESSELTAIADDDAAAELGEGDDDDIVRRIARKKSRPALADGDQADSSRRAGGGHSRLVAGLLVAVALAAGVGIGWAVATRPWDKQPVAAATQMLSSEAGAVDTQARIAELEADLKAHPDDADAHLSLGVLLFNRGDIEAARDHWVTVTELVPDEVDAWYNLGFYYLSTDPADMEAAYSAWQKVIDLEPDSDLAATVQTHIGGLMTATPSAQVS